MGYATVSDLTTYSLPSAAVASLSNSLLQAQLDAASSVADGYLRARYSLPLLPPYPADLVIQVCNYAAYTIMALRGYNQDAGVDIQIQQRYLTAIQWFESVERQRIHPAVIETPVAAPKYQFPQVATGPLRGW
jgi:phage gp36-like protein